MESKRAFFVHGLVGRIDGWWVDPGGWLVGHRRRMMDDHDSLDVDVEANEWSEEERKEKENLCSS